MANTTQSIDPTSKTSTQELMKQAAADIGCEVVPADKEERKYYRQLVNEINSSCPRCGGVHEGSHCQQ